jgi:hypothetical protein
VGADMAGRRIYAEIVDNEFVGPTTVVGMSEGIRVANFVGADGGVVVVTLRRNQAHGFQLGCILANNRSSNAIVHVESWGDRFFANGLGCQVAGGLSQAASGLANSNSTTFEARGSRFVDNAADIPGFEKGGIRVVGALSTTQPNVASNNTVTVVLRGTKVSNNGDANFAAIGALMGAPTGLAGTNNHVTIKLYGASRKIGVTATPSLPEEPGGTNTVTVIR